MTGRTMGAAAAALALLTALPAAAGIVITSETSFQDASGKVSKAVSTVSVEGNRQRAESGDAISIVDIDKDLVLTLTPSKKLYRQASLKHGPMAMGAATAAQVTYKARGTHQTAAGNTCDDYLLEMGPVTQVQCFARSGPGAAESIAFNRKMFEAVGAKMPDSVPQGLVLVMETHADPVVTRTVVTSIKTRSVPASAFEIPAGYKKDAKPDPMEEMMKKMQGSR